MRTAPCLGKPGTPTRACTWIRVSLTRYALERFLYRLSTSSHADQFLLKGALLFDLWFDIPHRPTRDADLLGFGSAELPHLEAVFRDVCSVEQDDGIHFQADSVRAEAIRKEASYSGVRITLIGLLDGARCHTQIDVGFGDAVTPGPDAVEFPVILPAMPAPRLRAYPRATVVAEKLEALVSLGIANSRMKDYFDLWVLSRYADFEGEILYQAIHATFERRMTPLPEGTPFGLSDDFAQDRSKQIQWHAFLKKNTLAHLPLSDVVTDLRAFLSRPLRAVKQRAVFRETWHAGHGWTPAS
ncbi:MULTISPECIES: nucleotidyl transferase AbiEii/AbiGii toxin family protein [unclassified Thioalkalivibrio]|uniref:nucleotidyl transferase AbiEii/AbiGii toxin family protein n=1 Tax=Thioalkalivibrio sp. ALE12 TaxID=1158170 RepID=UPI0018C9AAAF